MTSGGCYAMTGHEMGRFTGPGGRGTGAGAAAASGYDPSAAYRRACIKRSCAGMNSRGSSVVIRCHESTSRCLMLTSRWGPLPAPRPTLRRPCVQALSSSPSPAHQPRTAPDASALNAPSPISSKPSSSVVLRAAQDATTLGLAPTEFDQDCYEQEQQQEELQRSSGAPSSSPSLTWDFTQAAVTQQPFQLPEQQQQTSTNLSFPSSTSSSSSTEPPPQDARGYPHLQAAADQAHPPTLSPLLPPLLSASHRPSSSLFTPPLSTSPVSTPATATAAPISLAAWGALLLLSLSYMHQACNSFSLPVMFPAVSAELGLDDMQGAILTTGYSYLYALALLPIGLLCDRLPRPKLLAAGVFSWSALTLLASGARNFGELLAARVGFAAAQAVQNPISFALIPELFPNNKSMAVSIYNCSVYLGRALSYGAALASEEVSKMRQDVTAVAAGAGASSVAASQLTPAEGAASLIFVPLDKLDLRLVSIVYTRGDYAAVMPHFGYTSMGGALEDLELMDPASRGSEAVSAVMAAAGETGWREVLRWVAAPGFLIALAIVLALPEPRDEAPGQGADSASSNDGPGAKDHQEHAVATAACFLNLLRSPAFMFTTLAASFNDVGSYALMAWQSTFYERVYHLEPAQYAPMLAAVLPIGGIIGGVGGGWLADKAAGARNGSRVWVTAGAGAAAAPVLLLSMLAGDANESFLALMVGFSLSEAWRAPGANMARSVAPPEMGSSASALYLCIRNLVGGMGPIGVTLLTQHLGGDLQRGMLLVPAMYLASGAMFYIAEQKFAEQEGGGPPGTSINSRNEPSAV